jgi:hypothetical protein
MIDYVLCKEKVLLHWTLDMGILTAQARHFPESKKARHI